MVRFDSVLCQLERVRGKSRSSGQPKCLARFTRGILRQKLVQLMLDDCSQCLVRGQKATTFKPTARWFSLWQREYGLSMQKPNRKYKVHIAIMAERLEIGWINVARVRDLCLAVHGYDPEIDNWDRSPFHHNESGSQNMATLAVAGRSALVPLVDGACSHEGEVDSQLDDLLERRTPHGRMRSPYCEIMFKGTPEGP